MPVNVPVPIASDSSETQIFYFSRSRMALALIFFVTATVVPLLLLAYYSLDPDWMPQQPDFSRRRKGVFLVMILWAFFVLFMKLPFWIRIPFLLWSSYKFLRFFTRVGTRAFDREPDFIISPEGVSAWSGRNLHHVPWSAMTKLSVLVKVPTYAGMKVGPTERRITFYGPETGGRRFFNTLPPGEIELHFVQGLFPEKAETILRLVQKYRPDLVNEGDLIDLARSR